MAVFFWYLVKSATCPVSATLHPYTGQVTFDKVPETSPCITGDLVLKYEICLGPRGGPGHVPEEGGGAGGEVPNGILRIQGARWKPIKVKGDGKSS